MSDINKILEIKEPDIQNTVENSIKGLGWISFMRTAAWIFLIILILLSLAGSATFIEKDGLLGAFLLLSAGFLFSFLSVAGIMIFLDMAENIAYIRKNIENKR